MTAFFGRLSAVGLGFWLTVGCSLLSLSAHAQGLPNTYTVQEGDSCRDIVNRFAPALTLEMLHQLNDSLSGPSPHALTPGTVLRLVPAPQAPRETPALNLPDATLTFVRPRVLTTPPLAAQVDGFKGQELFRQYKVETRTGATSEVTFRDLSRVFMQENATIIIYGSGGEQAKKLTVPARKLELRLGTVTAGAALSNNPGTKAATGEPLSVETPGAAVVARSRSLRLEVDEAKTSRLSVYDGEAQLGAQGKQVRVREDEGSLARQGQAPIPARKLPATPIWRSEEQLIWVRFGETLVGEPLRWGFSQGAEQLIVELARQDETARAEKAPSFQELVINTRVEAANRSFMPSSLELGKYWARVSSRDALGLVGKPSSAAEVEVVALSLGKLQQTAGGQWVSVGQLNLTLPEQAGGLRFWLNGKPLEGQALRVQQPGTYQLGLGAVGRRAPFWQTTLVIQPLSLSMSGDAQLVPLRGGTLVFEVAGVSPSGSPVELEKGQVKIVLEGAVLRAERQEAGRLKLELEVPPSLQPRRLSGRLMLEGESRPQRIFEIEQREVLVRPRN
ncbi:MAG: FecR domain-containing protein [Myxococcota bacterium]